MAPDSPDFDDLRALVRSRAMSTAEARKVATEATSAIMECRTGADLCDLLTATLESVVICDWLGRDVGLAMRARAVDLINQIEKASSSAGREVTSPNQLVWSEGKGISPVFMATVGLPTSPIRMQLTDSRSVYQGRCRHEGTSLQYA
jgi:hypothetical protein